MALAKPRAAAASTAPSLAASACADGRPSARRTRSATNRLEIIRNVLPLPMPEAASVLGIPLGTAKSRLHRSLSAMRIAMAIDETTASTPAPGGQFA